MSVSPSPELKLTPIEITELASWSFIKSYQRYHLELVELAKSSYIATCHLLNASPTEDQFHQVYRQMLTLSNLYIKQIAGKKAFLPISVYDHFADLLAKYVREMHWAQISSVPYP